MRLLSTAAGLTDKYRTALTDHCCSTVLADRQLVKQTDAVMLS